VVTDDAPAPNALFALLDRVDPTAAPVPRNASERMLFRQLYETLVIIDCEGRIQPGLAVSWTAQEQGLVWTFRLRADATFWDERPVLAADVLASWSANAQRAPAAHAAVGSATATSERELRVELRSASSRPLLFAHPAFAVARPAAQFAPPIGSAMWRLESHDVARGITRMATRATGTRTIELHTILSADARRALDADADAVITGDPGALAYARALPGYTSSPLPWSRTYVLAARGPRSDQTVPPPDALLELARDAVRGDARPAQFDGKCWPALANTATAPAAPLRLFLYPREDATARSLAERLVALSWPAARAPSWLRAILPASAETRAPTALGLEARALLDSLRSGAPHAYVLPLLRTAGDACNDTAWRDDMLSSALASAQLGITPLLDTREHLIQRAGLGRVLVDSDGTIRFQDRRP
jgi:hypothetical protein